RSVASYEIDLQYRQAARLTTKAEMLVESERAVVAFLCVDQRTVDASPLHPTQTVERERLPDTAMLMIGVDGETLEEPARSGTSRHRVCDHVLVVVDDAEATRWRRAQCFVEAGFVEAPERLERPSVDGERTRPIETPPASCAD